MRYGRMVARADASCWLCCLISARRRRMPYAEFKENITWPSTAEQIARRIVELLEQRHTNPGEHDMFGAIAARLADEGDLW